MQPAPSTDLLELAPRERPFSVKEYHAMAQSGILTKDDRIELLDGRIITMAAIGSSHLHCVNRLTELLSRRVYQTDPPLAIVSVQNPVRLGSFSEPEPDLVLLDPHTPQDRTPLPQDVLLLIEVADTSLNYDWRVKGPRYAAAGIPEYWIVALEEKRIGVFRSPQERGYAEVSTHEPGDALTIAALPDLPPIPVSEVLG